MKAAREQHSGLRVSRREQMQEPEAVQGSRSYPPDISHPEITFTISRLPIPCPQPSVLCSFLPFWADDGNRQADSVKGNPIFPRYGN